MIVKLNHCLHFYIYTEKYNGGSLLMSPVFVLCVEYNEHSHDYPSAVKSTKYTLHPVFRIRKCVSKFLYIINQNQSI